MFYDESKLETLTAGLNRISALVNSGEDVSPEMEKYILNATNYVDSTISKHDQYKDLPELTEFKARFAGGVEAFNWKKAGVGAIIAAIIAAIVAFIAKMKNKESTSAPVEKIVDVSQAKIETLRSKANDTPTTSSANTSSQQKPSSNNPIYQDWEHKFPALPPLTSDDVRKVYSSGNIGESVERLMFQKLVGANEGSRAHALARGISIALLMVTTKRPKLTDAKNDLLSISYVYLYMEGLVRSVGVVENHIADPKANHPHYRKSSDYINRPNSTSPGELAEFLKEYLDCIEMKSPYSKNMYELNPVAKTCVPPSAIKDFIINKSTGGSGMPQKSLFAIPEDLKLSTIKSFDELLTDENAKVFSDLENNLKSQIPKLDLAVKTLPTSKDNKESSFDFLRECIVLSKRHNHPELHAQCDRIERIFTLEPLKVINDIRSVYRDIDVVISTYKNVVKESTHEYEKMVTFFSSHKGS